MELSISKLWFRIIILPSGNVWPFGCINRVEAPLRLYTEKIIKESIKGNARAQRTIFDAHSGSMMKLCRRYLKNAPDAEDAFIKAFNKVFEKLSYFEFRGKDSLSKWITTIMINECLMMLRQRLRMEKIEDLGAHQIPFQESIPSDAEYLYALILNLPLGYRTVFNLFAIEGYSHKEIGDMLGIAEGTSKSQLSKARQLLQSQIEEMKKRYGT